MVTVHAPTSEQQAPVDGGGQRLGAQVPDVVQSPVQDASRVTVQRPSARLQQEPSGGCGQVFGAQTPSRIQIPVQLAWSVTVQVPAAAQQAPGGAQGFGEHDWPMVHMRPGAQPVA